MTTKHLVARSKHYKRLLPLAVALAVFAGSAMTEQSNAATGQVRPTDPSMDRAKALAFEVVSIRPSKPGSTPGGGVSSTGFYMKGQSLWSTIMSVYFPMTLWSNDRLQGAPPWVLNENYDIQAKFDEATAQEFSKMTIAQRQERVRPMLQALLADRCKLVLHRVPAQTSALALVVGKRGVNTKELTLATPGRPIPPGVNHLPEGALMNIGPGKLTFFETSMASLAGFLSHSSERPVLDRTGLVGKYDFALMRRDDSGASPNDPEPSTHWKVEDLGLTVKSAKAETETLVVDRIERPSAN